MSIRKINNRTNLQMVYANYCVKYEITITYNVRYMREIQRKTYTKLKRTDRDVGWMSIE